MLRNEAAKSNLEKIQIKRNLESSYKVNWKNFLT